MAGSIAAATITSGSTGRTSERTREITRFTPTAPTNPAAVTIATLATWSRSICITRSRVVAPSTIPVASSRARRGDAECQHADYTRRAERDGHHARARERLLNQPIALEPGAPLMGMPSMPCTTAPGVAASAASITGTACLRPSRIRNVRWTPAGATCVDSDESGEYAVSALREGTSAMSPATPTIVSQGAGAAPTRMRLPIGFTPMRSRCASAALTIAAPPALS